MKTRHPKLSKDTKNSSIRVWEGLQICDQNQNQKARGKRRNCWCQHTWASSHNLEMHAKRL